MNAAYFLLCIASQGILFKTNFDYKLHAYVDVDWGSCLDTGKSTSSFCIFSATF